MLISFKKLRHSTYWMRTSVFLSDAIRNAVLKIDPKAQGALTYLVNAIERKQADVNSSNLIPYSWSRQSDLIRLLSCRMISRTTRSLNEWAVRDLNLTVGDEVTLQYFSVGERRKLLEQNATFRLRTIVPMPEPLGEESMDSCFRLVDAESCREWDTGIPVTHEIRSRTSNIGMNTASPKAFVSQLPGNGCGTTVGVP